MKRTVSPVVIFAVHIALIAGRLAEAKPPAAEAAAAIRETRFTARSSAAYGATLRQTMSSLTSAGVPGVVVYVRDGTWSLTLASGVREIASRTPIRRTDRFRVGSITKSFIATLLLRLEAESKISINDTVERWVPGAIPNGANITIRELLNHTSGLFDYFTDDLFLSGLLPAPLRQYTPQELLAIADAHPPLFAPGTQWSYSNTNYIVAGLILEAVTRTPLADTLRKDVFRRLKLQHTTFEQDPHLRGAYAHGYVGTLDVSVFNPSIAWAAGALASNAHDLARFYRALLRGRVLRHQQLDEMETLVPDGDPGEGYGLGVVGNSHTLSASLPCGPAIWGHDGDFPGYLSVALNTRDASRQVVVLANTDLLTGDQQSALTDVIRSAWCGLGS